MKSWNTLARRLRFAHFSTFHLSCDHIAWLMSLLLYSAVTRELPNHVPFVVQKKFIGAIIAQWSTPSRALFDATTRTLNVHVMRIIEDHFGAYAYGGLKQSIA